MFRTNRTLELTSRLTDILTTRKFVSSLRLYLRETAVREDLDFICFKQGFRADNDLFDLLCIS